MGTTLVSLVVRKIIQSTYIGVSKFIKLKLTRVDLSHITACSHQVFISRANNRKILVVDQHVQLLLRAR